MNITKTSFGTVFTLSTVKYESIPILLTFECDGEMDVFSLNVHYEDTDGTKILTHFILNESLTTYSDRTTIAYDVCEYVNSCISEHSSAIRKKFKIIAELCNYIDNIIDEVMKKYKIEEQNE